MLELLSQTVSARRKPEQALGMLQQVAANAPIVKSTRGSASEVVPRVLEMVSPGLNRSSDVG
jgi:hypothetical protein